jgi:hypothetical protein
MWQISPLFFRSDDKKTTIAMLISSYLHAMEAGIPELRE